MEFNPKEIRRKIEGFLAPENVRNGIPTRFPERKAAPGRPLTDAELQEEAADHHEESEGEEAYEHGDRRAFVSETPAQTESNALSAEAASTFYSNRRGWNIAPMSGRLAVDLHAGRHRPPEA